MGSRQKTTLKTFFVTASLYGFAKEYRVYCKEEMGGHRPGYCVDDMTLLVDHDQQYGPGPPEDPESIAIDRDTLRHILPSNTDPALLTILVRSAQNFTQKEIAAELDITEEAVSNRIRRFRRRSHPYHRE
jgi:DNA-directed RNA polymerase specialized sigma24 family protein